MISGRAADTLASAVVEIGDDTFSSQLNIADLQQIKVFFSGVEDALRHIDVLFIDSGRCSFCPIERVTEEDWHSVHDTHLRGVFFCVQAALPLMANPSAIVFTGSTAGSTAAADAAVYAASKAAVRSLGRSLAAGLLHRGIRVNVVSPGETETGKGATKEVAEAALFLASDASGLTTGAEFFVDGGMTSFGSALASRGA